MENDILKISFAGLEFKAPDSGGYVFKLEPIDDARRTADGMLFIQTVAIKRTLSLTWSALNGDELGDMLNTLENNRTGELIFYNPSLKAMDKRMVYYGAGAGATAKYLRFVDDAPGQLWTALNINFIEM